MRAFLLLALCLSVPASAAETITYVYDARGRLVQVVRTGTVNNGGITVGDYGDRITVTVTENRLLTWPGLAGLSLPR